MAEFAIVAASGGDYLNVDAAIDAGEFSIFVKAGESVGGWTQDVQYVEVHTGPGVTVTSDINVTGANCSLILGPGTDVQGEIDSTTGTKFYLECRNGVDIDGIDINTAYAYVNGGGWGTISDGGITIAAYASTGDDCIVENIALDTTTGGTGEESCLISGSRNGSRLIKVIDSEEEGVDVSYPDGLFIGWCLLGSDLEAFKVKNARTRVVGCYAAGMGVSLATNSNGDDSVISGNVFDAGINSINASSENLAVVGNRVDTTLIDSSGTSTVAANDLTAF